MGFTSQERPSVHGWVFSSDEWDFIHASAKKAFAFIYLWFYLCPYRKALSVINIVINNGQHSTTTWCWREVFISTDNKYSIWHVSFIHWARPRDVGMMERPPVWAKSTICWYNLITVDFELNIEHRERKLWRFFGARNTHDGCSAESWSNFDGAHCQAVSTYLLSR